MPNLANALLPKNARRFFMYINDLIDEFKIDLEINNFSKESIRVYTNSLKIFNKYMEEVLSITEIEQIKPSHLKAFQNLIKKED